MKRLFILAAMASFVFVATAADKTKVACIGDSITYGYGLKNREAECYPTQLQKLLDEKFPGVYEVRNFGNSGRGIYLDSMRGEEKRGYRHMKEHNAALDWKPDIVICNLGINDCGEYIKEFAGGRHRGQFVHDYVMLLSDYAKLEPKPKFFIWTKLTPLAEGQRFYRSPEPFLMQADLEKVARKTNARSIDMQEPLRDKMEEILAKDKLHPNADGARMIAEATFKAMTTEAPGPVELPDDLEESKREVWLCAGQSNMQKGWGEFNGSPIEKSRVSGEMAHLSKVDVRFWDFNDGNWKRLTPQNAMIKCAFGVSFAIRRATETKKTIVMLYVAAGGAPTESFISERTMCAVREDGSLRYPYLATIATNRHSLDKNADFPCAWVAREYSHRRNNKEEAAWWPVSKIYDGGLARLNGLPIDGILWYQGESNATTCVAPDKPTPKNYQEQTLRAVVEELRALPSRRNIPFIMIGLPKMNRPWDQYRAAQKKVAEEMDVTFVDTFAAGLGETNDVHPRDKTAFAELAAKAAAEAFAAQ